MEGLAANMPLLLPSNISIKPERLYKFVIFVISWPRCITTQGSVWAYSLRSGWPISSIANVAIHISKTSFHLAQVVPGAVLKISGAGHEKSAGARGRTGGKIYHVARQLATNMASMGQSEAKVSAYAGQDNP